MFCVQVGSIIPTVKRVYNCGWTFCYAHLISLLYSNLI